MPVGGERMGVVGWVKGVVSAHLRVVVWCRLISVWSCGVGSSPPSASFCLQSCLHVGAFGFAPDARLMRRMQAVSRPAFYSAALLDLLYSAASCPFSLGDFSRCMAYITKC